MLFRRPRCYDNPSRLDEVSAQPKQVADTSRTPSHYCVEMIGVLSNYGFEPLGNHLDVSK